MGEASGRERRGQGCPCCLCLSFSICRWTLEDGGDGIAISVPGGRSPGPRAQRRVYGCRCGGMMGCGLGSGVVFEFELWLWLWQLCCGSGRLRLGSVLCALCSAAHPSWLVVSWLLCGCVGVGGAGEGESVYTGGAGAPPATGRHRHRHRHRRTHHHNSPVTSIRVRMSEESPHTHGT